jgi:hypothetical protein
MTLKWNKPKHKHFVTQNLTLLLRSSENQGAAILCPINAYPLDLQNLDRHLHEFSESLLESAGVLIPENDFSGRYERQSPTGLRTHGAREVHAPNNWGKDPTSCGLF